MSTVLHSYNVIPLPEEIYKRDLEYISDIKFTPREIDVIACILNGKSLKGISEFLSTTMRPIGEKSIATHILNIRRKIGGSAKDSIINFVESSNKHQIIRDYYQSLIIQKEFVRTLYEINSSAKKTLSSVVIVNIRNEDNFSDITHKLASDLGIFFSNSALHTKESFLDIVPVLGNIDKETSYLFILPKNDYINNQQLLERIVETNREKNGSNNIVILLHRSIENPNNLDKELPVEFIDVDNCKSYYFLLFNILKGILPELNINKSERKFEERYNSIKNPLYSLNSITTGLLKPKNNLSKFNSLARSNSQYFFLALLLVLGVGLLSISFPFKTTSNKEISNNLDKSSISQNNFYTLLTRYNENLSVRNLSKEQAEANYSIIQEFGHIIQSIVYGNIDEQFNVCSLKHDEFINCLYNLNAIASYILFKEHNADKAARILLYAKSSAEKYVSARSRMKINFEILTPAETLTELSIIKDLPEMYAVTIYFLGRKSIYLKETDLAEKYFNISRYLGDKLNLFQAILSVMNGHAIVKSDRIDILIKNSNFSLAISETRDCIKIYSILQKDNKLYKKDYRPNNHKPESIIPNQDIYHITDCCKRIIKLYTKLLSLSNVEADRSEALETISYQVFGKYDSKGVLDLLKQHNTLSRITADLYNNLGHFLLVCYDKGYKFEGLKNQLISRLNFKHGNDLEIIYQLFDEAKSLSRNTEFSKADACLGLVKVCERLIAQPIIADTKKKELTLLMNKFKILADSINKELQRPNVY